MTRSERRAARVAAACLLLALPVTWAVLPPVLRTAALPQAERDQLEARAAQLAAMTPDARATLVARVAAWRALPAQERRRRRIAHETAAALPHAERVRLQQAASHFATLPEAEQRALRLEFAQLDQGVRRGWRLGPVLGLDWPGLHPLFSAVPQADRASTLLALRASSVQARADLAALAQRTPPHEREALRRAWLDVPADARDAWLRARVSGAP